MPLKFHCVCGQALVVSRRLVGKGVRCPSCDIKVKVPALRARTAETHTAAPPGIHSSDQRVTLTPPPAESPDSIAEEVTDSVIGGAVVHGCEPDPRDVAATQWLAGGLATVALCGVSPALFDIGEHFRATESPGVAVWAYLAMWIALVQISYAVYLAQLPDWSSVWVATLVTLAIAGGYAMLLALTYLSRADGWLVTQLGLADHLAGGRAAGWCLIMVCLTSLVSYLSGRMSVRWYHATN